MDRFFGLKIEAGKSVKQTLPLPLHLTQVALDAAATKEGRTSLQITIDEQTHTVGSCRSNQVDQFPLDLLLNADTEVTFKSVGPNALHVLGSYIIVDTFDDDDESINDGEFSSEGEEDVEGDLLEDVDEDEEAAINSAKSDKGVTFDPELANRSSPVANSTKQRKDTPKKKAEPVEQEQPEKPALTKNQAKKQRQQAEKEKQTNEAASNESNKRKSSQLSESPNKDIPKDTIALKEEAEAAQQSKKAKTQASQESKETAVADKKSPKNKKEQTTPDMSPLTTPRKSIGGMVLEDLKLGNGQLIEDGKKIGVKYIGKLSNGKTFDSSLQKIFSFRYGVNEVIKGWDLGLKGMRVGGKRKLTIPPKLGYGSSRAGAIPPNSTLEFEVELCKVF